MMVSASLCPSITVDAHEMRYRSDWSRFVSPVSERLLVKREYADWWT